MSQLARNLQSEIESLESARREAFETLQASQLASAEAAQAQVKEAAAREKAVVLELGDALRESQVNAEAASRKDAQLRVVKAECDELRAAAARGGEAAVETDGLRSQLAAREAEARRAAVALSGVQAQLDGARVELVQARADATSAQEELQNGSVRSGQLLIMAISRPVW